MAIVSVGFFRNRLGFRVTNSGGTALKVTQYEMTFPSGIGNLKEVIFPPYYYWQGEKSSPVTISGPESSQDLEDGESGILYHVFDKVPVLSGIYAKITFSGGSYFELNI